MIEQPLLPQTALGYFEDAITQKKPYLRLAGLRNCLENIVDTFFICLADEKKFDVKKWNRTNLHNKIEHLKSVFSLDIADSLHRLRSIGNKGAHHRDHAELDTFEIDVAIQEMSNICEAAILAYFRKNGFEVSPWLPTVFSTLPPVYRVRILEPLYSEQKSLLLLDKLAMAYLKAGDYNRSIYFIEQCHTALEIDKEMRDDMVIKIDMLRKSLPYLPIAHDMKSAAQNLRAVLRVVEEKDMSLFITMVTALVTGYECTTLQGALKA